MLDYTKMAIRQTISDLKKTDYVRNVATQIIYIIYLVYTLIVGTGYLALNIILLTLSLAYFVFFLATTSLGKTPEGKTLKRTGRNIYVWTKRLVKLFTLGLTVYGICTAVEHVSPVSVILAALMIVGWLLQIIFEVLIKILTNRVNFILEGLEADLDHMLKPVRSVGNFFKKVTGKEVAPPKPLTKNQLKLKEKVEAYRAEQKRKKEAEKLLKEERKAAEKQLSKEQKRSEKQELKLLRAAEKRQKAEAKAALREIKAPSEERKEDVILLPPPDADEEAALYFESADEKELCEAIAQAERETEETEEAEDGETEIALTDDGDGGEKAKSFFGSIFRRKKG